MARHVVVMSNRRRGSRAASADGPVQRAPPLSVHLSLVNHTDNDYDARLWRLRRARGNRAGALAGARRSLLRQAQGRRRSPFQNAARQGNPIKNRDTTYISVSAVRSMADPLQGRLRNVHPATTAARRCRAWTELCVAVARRRWRRRRACAGRGREFVSGDTCAGTTQVMYDMARARMRLVKAGRTDRDALCTRPTARPRAPSPPENCCLPRSRIEVSTRTL